MVFDAPAWEKLYWYLRLLIPQLKVPQNGGIDISDLLDNSALNTYALSRTALNVHIDLDDEETVLDPLAAKMVNAGPTEETRTAFDIILEHFNERHMGGWDATPAEQRTKIVRIAGHHGPMMPNTSSQVVGNPDTEAADRRFEEILNRIMTQQRSADLTLYREYRDAGFRRDFINLVRTAIENADHLSSQHYPISTEPPVSYAAEP